MTSLPSGSNGTRTLTTRFVRTVQLFSPPACQRKEAVHLLAEPDSTNHQSTMSALCLHSKAWRSDISSATHKLLVVSIEVMLFRSLNPPISSRYISHGCRDERCRIQMCIPPSRAPQCTSDVRLPNSTFVFFTCLPYWIEQWRC